MTERISLYVVSGFSRTVCITLWRRPLGLRIRHLLLVAACVFQLVPAGATVLVPSDLGELSRDAGAIVCGRVVAVESRWTGDRRAIETLVTVEAEASLKGSLGATIHFLVPGGVLGRYRSLFVGAPEFSSGERIVVFLGWRAPSYPYVLGLSQGLFRIVPAADGSGWLVTPPPMLAPSTGRVPIVRGDPSRRPQPLAEFEQRVRAFAGAQR